MKEFVRIAPYCWDRCGFSIIPVNKKPYEQWSEFQKRKPTDKEIERWAVKYPNAMIGIVTGSLSGLFVIE